MMRKPIAFALQVSVTLLLLLAAVVGFAVWRASSVLKSAQRNLRDEREIRFAVRPLVAPSNTGFELVSSPAVFTQVARFQDNLYVAGPAGLLVYQSSGQFVRSYFVGRELPGSSLVALAPAVLADPGSWSLLSPRQLTACLPLTGTRSGRFIPTACSALTAPDTSAFSMAALEISR